MGRHDDGAAGQPGLDRRGQAGHGRRVERGGGLVEQQHGCGAEQGAGQGDALALAGAQREPVVADGGVEPGRQGRQQLGQAHGRQHVA